MEERRGNNPLLSWPALVLLVTMLGGAYYIPKRLQPSRPDEKPAGGRAGIGDQVAPARLWQDPFEVIERYETSLIKSGERGTADPNTRVAIGAAGIAEFAGLIRRYAATDSADSVGSNVSQSVQATILGVMVSGEAYTEDAEVRRRSRHALVSALGRGGYVPKSENRVGYLRVPWPRGAEVASMPPDALQPLSSFSGNRSLMVPFEWFEKSTLNPPELHERALDPGPIAVLWLNQAAFADFPKRRFAQLFETIRRAVPLEPDEADKGDARKQAGDRDNSLVLEKARPSASIQFTILNPGLNDMLEEPAGTTNGQKGFGDFFAMSDALRGTRLISAWSTSADGLLLRTNNSGRRLAISNQLATAGMELINATCTDDELACELIDELNLRQVDLIQKRDAVAILSDSDTFYGRALPLTFAATIQGQCERGSRGLPSVETLDSLRQNPDQWPKHLFSYTYLRGIDGKLPSEPRATTGEAGGKEGAASTKDLDRPEGHSQMDYLPRLAAALKERDLELRRSGQHGLRAIGVLGSDVYDKLLVLQSLHELFPDAIFFTTDLDARLLHPKELGWTRNMVVVSSFGLSLNRQIQGSVPPFRDTYQTALFLATLAAVNDRRVTPEILASMKPRRFEIGRNGAYDISVAASSPSLHPPRANTFPGTSPSAVLTRGLSYTLVLGGLCLLLFTSLWKFKDQELRPLPEIPDGAQTPLQVRLQCAFRAMNGIKWICWLGASVSVAALIGGVWASHLDARGEPFSLTDGISIWPGTLLRMAAACLSLWLLGQARIVLRASKRRLADDFGMPEVTNDMSRQVAADWAARTESRLPRWWDRLRAYREWIGIRTWTFDDVKVGNQVDADKLWADYNRKGWLLHRTCRFAVPALIYVTLSFLLIRWTGELFVPHRGPSSQNWHVLTLIGSVSLQILLTFYVVDATRLCCRLVEIQMPHTTRWSDLTCARFRDGSGIHEEYLSDWIDINFIAQRTKDVDRLIYYPFAVLFLMILARLPFFDRWTWPVSLIVILGLNSLIALLAVCRLRITAEKARSFALERLNKHLVTAMNLHEDRATLDLLTTDSPTSPAFREITPSDSNGRAAVLVAPARVEVQVAGKAESQLAQIRWMIDEIKAMRAGAFAPIMEQPVLRAIMMPLGGGGLVALLEIFGR